MQVLRAQHLGMCFGVKDAIQMAHEEGGKGGLTVWGELVHNRGVVDHLEAKGIPSVRHLEDIPSGRIMITAHGASDRAVRRARERGHEVIEATCPLVTMVHESVLDLVRQGHHPVVVGKWNHVEVRGMTEDLEDYSVVLTDEDIAHLPFKPKFGVVAQTTQPLKRVWAVVDRIRERFPSSKVRFVDTVCQPTKARQAAARELARQCDVVIVIGGTNSNNTRELAATCREHCALVHRVQSAAEINCIWLVGAQTVGITAGTSTPDRVIDAVEAELLHLSKSDMLRDLNRHVADRARDGQGLSDHRTAVTDKGLHHPDEDTGRNPKTPYHRYPRKRGGLEGVRSEILT